MGHRSNDDDGALDPAAIADQRFPVRFRGYDRAAVAVHLARVADAHRAALDWAASAEEALADATAVVAPGPIVTPEPIVDEAPVDEEPATEDETVDEPDLDDPAQRFGDDLAEVVRTTRLRVLEIEDNASRRAEETVARAEQQAARIVQAAQARADHLTAAHDRLVARLVDARAELAEVLDRLDGARIDEARTDEASIDEARVEQLIDLSEPEVGALDDEHLEGEDDPAFDRMVRDALDRAVRLGRAHSDDT